MSNPTQQPSSEQPTLLSSHAQYAKAQAVVCPIPIPYPSFSPTNLYSKDAVGSITGSKEWKESGHAQKEEAIANMRAASENRDPATSGYGKAEELAGKVTGCEGMENEGAVSAKKE